MYFTNGLIYLKHKKQISKYNKLQQHEQTTTGMNNRLVTWYRHIQNVARM